MRACVTGGAGFIGSTLVDRLLRGGSEVVIYDNFSTGQREFLADAIRSPRATLIEADILDRRALVEAFDGCDVVFHLAANADVRFGLDHPDRDLRQNTFGTFEVLEAMRATGIKRIAFASTGSVYGDSTAIPTPEHAPFPVQTSLYGASKLAGEGLVSAYCEGFGFTGYVFRFVSILGERYTHGHVYDFCKSLLRNPSVLKVLGDGTQRKSYLYVNDCIDAILTAVERAPDRFNLFNLGTNDYCKVSDSVGWITNRLGVNPVLEFSGGDRGWVGDNPFIFLDCSRIRGLGWAPTVRIEDAVTRTVDFLTQNRALLEPRQ